MSWDVEKDAVCDHTFSIQPVRHLISGVTLQRVNDAAGLGFVGQALDDVSDLADRRGAALKLVAHLIADVGPVEGRHQAHGVAQDRVDDVILNLRAATKL